MRVLFDTGIMADLWGERGVDLVSFKAIDVAALRDFVLCMTAGQVSSLAVLLSELLPKNEDASRALRRLLSAFEILDLDEDDCLFALDNPGPNCEAAFVSRCAQRHAVDVIISRDLHSYANSPVPVLSPAEFTRLHKPGNVEYEVVESE